MATQETVYYSVKRSGKAVAKEVLRIFKKHPDFFKTGVIGDYKPEELCGACVLGVASLVCGAERGCYPKSAYEDSPITPAQNKTYLKFIRRFNSAAEKLGYTRRHPTGFINVYHINDSFGREVVCNILKEASK